MLFFILKIIGMILLAILGVLILLLCTVFFVPANYIVQAKTDDGVAHLSFEAKAHWMLHLFTAYYVYKENKSEWQVRIGWKTFNHKDHKEYKNEDVEDVKTVEREDNVFDKVETGKSADEPPNIKKKKPSLFEKIKCTILKICDKMKTLWETKEKITTFLTDDIHVKAFQIIKKEIKILATHLRPRRIRGFVRFGMEDPYRTGQILAGLSILYPFYGDNIDIYPDFEEKIFETDLYIKGHIRTVHLATLLWRLFFNRYVRKTYRDYKMLKSS